MELFVFLVSLAILLLFGIPIAIVLVLCSLVLMFFMGNYDSLIIGQQMVMGTDNFTLMAIPFFILAGEIMSKGGLSERIVRFAQLIVGRIRGGLGYTAVIASIIFAGLSGSAIADAAALGSILIPLMVKSGYRSDRSSALICSSSLIAPIIPPSIPMIVLGATVGLSTSRLFMAGIVPGFILGFALMITWFFVVRIDKYDDKITFEKGEVLKTVVESFPALVMPLIIIGGIRLGIVTPTEAGTIAVVYAFLICRFWYKELSLRDMTEIFVSTAKSTAIVMFVVGAASCVGWCITLAQIPLQFIDFFQVFIDRPTLLLFIINGFLILLGMVMDMTPNMLIFAPIIFPLIQKAGIDPIYFGVIMILNLLIGLMTPPVGTLLYLTCSFGKVSLKALVKSILPFLLVETLVLVLFIVFPGLITYPLKILTGK